MPMRPNASECKKPARPAATPGRRRRENLRSAHSNIELHAQAKQQAVDRKVKGPDPAFGGNVSEGSLGWRGRGRGRCVRRLAHCRGWGVWRPGCWAPLKAWKATPWAACFYAMQCHAMTLGALACKQPSARMRRPPS